MAYTLLFAKGVQKDLDKIPKSDGVKILSKIESLSSNPRPAGCKKLEGSDDSYRIRSGDYRILYSIFDKELVIDVVKIDHRKQVYR
jgi:mRNA interferase RelE/StbE